MRFTDQIKENLTQILLPLVLGEINNSHTRIKVVRTILEMYPNMHVKCDEDNNTLDVINNCQLVIDFWIRRKKERLIFGLTAVDHVKL